MTAIERICAAAEKEVGYLEKSAYAYKINPAVLFEKTAGAGADNWTKYAYEVDKTDWYNGPKNGYAWCSVFVDWLFIHTFGFIDAIRIKNHGIYDAVVDYAIDQYKAVGRYFREPMVGDQVFFSDGDGDPAHTGLVVGVGNGFITTVEGNTSDADGVIANGGCVARKRYPTNYSRIHGYGRPFYEIVGEEEKEEKEKEKIKMDFDKELNDALNARAELSCPDWAKEEWQEAQELGITDGTRPMVLCTRLEVGLMVERAVKRIEKRLNVIEALIETK